MGTASIPLNGQLTRPKDVREALDLHPGDRINFAPMEEENDVVLPAAEPVMALKGIVRKPSVSVSLDDMDRAIAAGASGG